VLQRLGQEASRVRRANAHRRPPGQGNRSGHALVEQASKHHHAHVASFAVGDPQPRNEAALDSHPRQRRGKNLPAAVNYQHLVAFFRQFGDLPRQRLDSRVAVEQRSCNLDH
jgi:hypothetical protein